MVELSTQVARFNRPARFSAFFIHRLASQKQCVTMVELSTQVARFNRPARFSAFFIHRLASQKQQTQLDE